MVIYFVFDFFQCEMKFIVKMFYHYYNEYNIDKSSTATCNNYYDKKMRNKTIITTKIKISFSKVSIIS